MVKFLDAAEALKVSSDSAWIVEKADSFISNLEDLLEKARASNVAQTTNHDQLYHQLESRFVQLKKEHGLAIVERDHVR